MPTVYGDTAQTYWQRVALTRSLARAQALLPYMFYTMLEEYYLNNGLYDLVNLQLHENAIWAPGMKPLRNPAHRAVEFYVSKLWPGTAQQGLPIVTDHSSIIDPIHKIWQWSNWSVQKQVAARWMANFGDMFIKVQEKVEGSDVTRVYLDPIKPRYVTDFELDERGFLTFFRVDIPSGDEMHTEVWSKEFGGYRLWRHTRSLETPLDKMGTPVEVKYFSDIGFDFIPVAHAKFQDIGELRGVGCFVHVLDKIDEANRQATRLHQILFRFNKPIMAVSANANDAQGRPLPPPVIQGRDGSSTDDGRVTLGDDDVWTLPGMSRLDQMVPNINYEAALQILNAQMDEISEDLPEILYYELKDKGDLSGIALRTILQPAIDKVVEARGNAEAALIRANQMALTIAATHQLPAFRNIGSFEKGDFEHGFMPRDIIPLTAREKAEGVKADVEAGIPLVVAMKKYNYTDEEIQDVIVSDEYRLKIEKLLWEAAKAASEVDIPMETFLRRMGWTNEMLALMGTQRLAAITLEQEDAIPETGQ